MSKSEEVYVAVSKFIHTKEWVDEKSGIKFAKDLGKIHIPKDVDTSNIRLWTTRNLIYVVTGDLNTCGKNVKPKEIVEDAPKADRKRISKEDMSKMTPEALGVYAQTNNIKIGKASTAKGIIAKILAAK